MKKVTLFVLLFVTIAVSQDTKDTVLVRQDGTAVKMQTRVLDKFDANFDGGRAISSFSNDEITSLFKGWKVFKREVVGHIAGANFPFFNRIEVAFDDIYSIKYGKLDRDRRKIDYSNGGEYLMTAIAYALILVTMFWILSSPPSLRRKEKTKMVTAFLVSLAIIMATSMIVSYAISWAIFSMSGVYEITAVGFFGAMVAIVSGVFTIIATVLGSNINVNGANWTGIVLIFLMSFILNISAGQLAGMEFGLFSRHSEAIWIFFGLYLATGFLALLTRILVNFLKRWDEPINIDLSKDPDLSKII